MMNKLSIVWGMLAGTLFVLVFSGCNRAASGARSFDQEFKLAVRAGRGELSETEKLQLLRENHPILAQVGEPKMRPLMRLFADLPAESHAELLERSYVKWRYAELDAQAQKTMSESIRVAVLTQQPPQTNQQASVISELGLEEMEVGFALVELPEAGQKVVSWFAIGSQLPSPVWITIVNAPAIMAEDYLDAHLQRLPLLRSLKPSPSRSKESSYVSLILAARA